MKKDLKVIASNLKDMIEDAIEIDQAGRYRELLAKWIVQMNDAYAPAKQKTFRSHCGASLIGSDCDRQIWLGYYWTKQPRFSAQILRLFNHGHLQEAHFCVMLELLGAEIMQQNEEGKQYNFSHSNSHAGGSLDGIVKNLPYFEDELLTCEFKTYNDRYFKELVKKGMVVCKPQHHAQILVGLEKFGLNYCIYMAINKNSSEIYVEIVEAQKYVAGHYLERFDRIVFSDKPPEKVADSPVAKECQWCDFVELCHRYDATGIDVNCRTCLHSYPSKDAELAGQWVCNKYNKPIPKDFALNGCNKWEQRVLW